LHAHTNRSPCLLRLRLAKAAGGDAAPLCRARAALREDHHLLRTDAVADGRHSLAAVTFDNSFRLLANKLLKLTAATRGLLDCRACARGTTPRALGHVSTSGFTDAAAA
jgi:hypothetical protein